MYGNKHTIMVMKDGEISGFLQIPALEFFVGIHHSCWCNHCSYCCVDIVPHRQQLLESLCLFSKIVRLLPAFIMNLHVLQSDILKE